MRKLNRGVTLMELLIVMVIIGLLAAIAMPAYRTYVIRGNRADAKAALLLVSSALERCYTRYNSYNDAACTVTLPHLSSERHYQVTAPTRTAIAFTLTATPQAGQAGDTDCANFSLTSSNVKSVSGTKPWEECWGR